MLTCSHTVNTKCKTSVNFKGADLQGVMAYNRIDVEVCEFNFFIDRAIDNFHSRAFKNDHRAVVERWFLNSSDIIYKTSLN